ncbi:surface lipoprotein assembly modifier [Vibrio aphrogenes]|uniref:surface lipoprotein assembly modifier n=1 Tax=Vibrio aphrogenes TaxID=1891186 RepID=UPI000B3642CE|nr:DUF2860 family protein [Vibrio aphrogenes]
MRIRQALLLFMIASPLAKVYAQETGQWQEGVSGTAMFLVGVTQSNSQADSGSETITSLEDKGKRESKGFVFPVASSHLSYTFSGGDNQLFIGTSNSDIALGRPHIQIGYGQYIDQVGVVKLSYIPGIIGSKTWQDPFLVGAKRQETDQTIEGVRLQYSEIFDTGLGMEISAGKNKLDDELSASQYSSQIQSQLNREGDLYYGELYYLTPVTRSTLLRSSFSYLRNQANGEAVSSNAYTGQIALFQRYQQSTLTLSLKYQYAKFDEIHPLFNLTQEDDAIGVVATYTYNDIFDWKGVGVGLLAGYREQLSNIDFYEYESWILGAGLRYVF